MNLDKTKSIFNKHVVLEPIVVNGVLLVVLRLDRKNSKRRLTKEFESVFATHTAKLEDKGLQRVRPTYDNTWSRDIG